MSESSGSIVIGAERESSGGTRGLSVLMRFFVQGFHSSNIILPIS
jgi:hypothetical protein